MTAPLNVTLLRPDPHQASSFAICVEMVETANRVARMHGQPDRFKLTITAPPEVPKDTQLVLVPGLGLATVGELRRTMVQPGFQALITALRQIPNETPIAAACSATFALGAAGLLDGRQTTGPWWLMPHLADLFPRAKLRQGDLIVEDGRITTAGAAFGQIDLMLHLITRYAGAAIAEDCRRFLMADSRPSQHPYVSVATLVAGDPALQQAELYLRQNLAQPITVADMAGAAGLGQRSFARRLQKHAALTPTELLQSLRISEAIRLARSTRLPQEEIAHRVGYGDATALRRLMRKRGMGTLDSYR